MYYPVGSPELVIQLTLFLISKEYVERYEGNQIWNIFVFPKKE